MTLTLALVATGFAALLAAVHAAGPDRVASHDPGHLLLALTEYFRVIWARGLAPQIALGAALWPAVRALWPHWDGPARPGRLWLGLWLAMTVAYAAVAPLVLMREGGARLVPQSPWDHLATYVGMTFATTLGAWISARALRALATRRTAVAREREAGARRR